MEDTSPWKDEAAYDHVRVGDEFLEDAAWSHPESTPAARRIAGHVTFDEGKGLTIDGRSTTGTARLAIPWGA